MSEELLYRISIKQRIIAARTRLHTLEPDIATQALVKAEIEMNEEFLDLADTYFLRRKAFHPDQPRVPAGNPDGGQWTDTGGGSSGSAQPVYMRREDPLSSPMALGGGGGGGGIVGGGTGSGILLAPSTFCEKGGAPPGCCQQKTLLLNTTGSQISGIRASSQSCSFVRRTGVRTISSSQEEE